jgi:hypothetical protein
MSNRLVLAILLLGACHAADYSRPPLGLARRFLAQPGFAWVERSAPPFRVYFLAGSYAAGRQDSLIDRLDTARRHAFEILDRRPDHSPMDVFFLESRLRWKHYWGGGPPVSPSRKPAQCS